MSPVMNAGIVARRDIGLGNAARRIRTSRLMLHKSMRVSQRC
jgi:hypothetical protein